MKSMRTERGAPRALESRADESSQLRAEIRSLKAQLAAAVGLLFQRPKQFIVVELPCCGCLGAASAGVAGSPAVAAASPGCVSRPVTRDVFGRPSAPVDSASARSSADVRSFADGVPAAQVSVVSRHGSEPSKEGLPTAASAPVVFGTAAVGVSGGGGDSGFGQVPWSSSSSAFGGFGGFSWSKPAGLFDFLAEATHGVSSAGASGSTVDGHFLCDPQRESAACRPRAGRARGKRR